MTTRAARPTLGRGNCSVCGKDSALRWDEKRQKVVIRAHGYHNEPYATSHCAGSGEPPAASKAWEGASEQFREKVWPVSVAATRCNCGCHTGQASHVAPCVCERELTGVGLPIMAPTKTRPGDQPLPTTNDQPYVQDQVMAYIERRKQIGISRYGTALQPFNGRDALVDALEEAVDLVQYLAQLIIERDGRLP